MAPVVLSPIHGTEMDVGQNTIVKGSMAIAKDREFVSGHDKPRLTGVAIAIDPFQVVGI